MHPIAREALEKLAQAGARIAAAGVDAGLEIANEMISKAAEEAQARIKRGRAHAQKIGRTPPRRVHVEGVEVEMDDDSTVDQ
jgi:hypothetical protein